MKMTPEREEKAWLLMDKIHANYRACHSKDNWRRRMMFGRRIYALLGLEFYR